MYSNFRVLCFSHDEQLQQTRQWILETRYEAVCVTSLDELQVQVALAGGFDVVILCHSLSRADCRVATEIARERWPQAKIVALAAQWSECAGPSGGANSLADRVVCAQEGPAVLMSSLEEMLPRGQMCTTAA